MSVYYLSARIRATDTQRLDETRRKLAELATVTRKEPACHLFSAFEDSQRSGDFILWECWEGKAGLEAHHAYRHTREYLAQELTEVVEITELTALLRKEL
ncbi:putative quinol monooxygenase [Pseudomonas sp. MYb185]|uniref:putative quinol monooxygenase n=1 Tax=Pseudomonas sp. MYb185 TaxID=1848729 RepID=UPI000CFD8A28|nr:antibiotic biosynthesis monooxygenase [Pseudomonas sp. MYb185]PRB78977.1 antibiotic biosynthesis monooxygenase [Pseudomonas sp. MYb185]